MLIILLEIAAILIPFAGIVTLVHNQQHSESCTLSLIHI